MQVIHGITNSLYIETSLSLICACEDQYIYLYNLWAMFSFLLWFISTTFIFSFMHANWLFDSCFAYFEWSALFLIFQEPTRPAVPILIAVGSVHQHLIQNGLRMSASIVVDTAQCFSTHQFACLIGYGARSFLYLWTFSILAIFYLVFLC